MPANKAVSTTGDKMEVCSIAGKTGGADVFVVDEMDGVGAVDKAGNTVDFLLRAHRDKAAARRYFEKAIDRNGAPETVTMDKSGANLAALQAINAERKTPIKIRQVKYLNNIVEQDHRAIKRRTRPMMGFKDFRCARIILSGIETMHMIRKGQMTDGSVARTAAAQFYSLVA